MRFLLSFLLVLMLIVAPTACSSSDPAPDRVWYTIDATTAPAPCLPKEDPRVAGFLETTWGQNHTRCVKSISTGPETNDKDDQGNPAREITCLYGVIWQDC